MLNQLALARQVKIAPETIGFYASSLSGFGEDVVTAAICEFQAEIPDQFAPRFPALEAVASVCRRLEGELHGKPQRRFYCGDCTYGLLYFDKAGKRLRGREIVIAEYRTTEECPCGGTETDWRALELDRRAHPENYFSYAEVLRDFLAKQAAK